MKKVAWGVIVMVSLAIAGFTGYMAASFVAGDACLDSGGSWRYLEWECER